MRGLAAGVVAWVLCACSSPGGGFAVDASPAADGPPVAAAWRRVHADGATGTPGERWGHALAWDGTRLLLWGTSLSGASDLWWFTPGDELWLQRIAGGTPGVPPNAHGVSLVWTGDQVLLFGGSTNAVHGYSPAANRWTEHLPADAPGSPPRRLFASMVWTGTAALLFGGTGGNPVTALNDVWSYDPAENRWTELVPAGEPASPAGRRDHVAVWTGTRMLVHGGSDLATFGFADLWSFDPATSTWTALAATGGGPGGRYAHAGSWTGTELAVFGGDEAGSDTWHYAPATNRWREAVPDRPGEVPPRRERTAMVWAGDRAYVYGGCTMTDGCFALADLWEYTPPAP